MGIATLADLKSQVAVSLNRSNLTSQIPYFVQLAETRIAYGSQEQPLESQPLRIRAMETAADLALVGGTQTVALPTGYLQQRRMYISGTPIVKPQFVSPDAFWGRWFSYTSGQPVDYTIEGENYVFGPTPASNYTGKTLYYKKFTTLSADADTNWLLTNAPGVYLHGTLIEAYKYVRNMEQAAASLNNFCGVVNALNSADKSDRHSTPWVARSDTWTP
jgi:hypothetical protein